MEVKESDWKNLEKNSLNGKKTTWKDLLKAMHLC